MPLSAAERLGRRWVHCGCMVLATVPILACVPLVSSHQAAVTALSITFKLVSNVGWFIMWVQAMEVTPHPVLSPVLTVCPQIIPTNLRSSGFTICSIVAKFVVMTGPFVVDLVFMDTIYNRQAQPFLRYAD